ncbi:hypothetical protein C2857_006930 [Epichloe festucae Fl1]|uniref:Aminoglycoside phosphotransferase domain-containing protein n=1 Tax=Epichloe festucae (strain Fl1) TaxID=877507 RepID=A0A7S9KQB8_EPIFF|nr:hypothetical protein C2857_006930 [Epichloe festucae Fl1]
MVHNGRISGIIDWESAGWYPEYWEFTTPMRWPGRNPRGLIAQLGGDRYKEELEAEMAIVSRLLGSTMA